MSFLAPLWLLVGAAAAVPLLLHLLRRNISAHVEFPAARYLERAEREHSRSLRIRNLLLMLLRVLLVLVLALAAARPFLRGVGAGHGPTALAVVLDNSLSTRAVVGGVPAFARVRDAARALITAAQPGDQLWLVTSDGRVRGGARDALLADVARVEPTEDAGDLPLALRRAAAAVLGSPLPAHSVGVATDGQRSAWAATLRVDVPVSLFVPPGTPPRNRAVSSAAAQPARWTPTGTVAVRVLATDSVAYRITIGSRTLARGSAGRGAPIQLRATPPERGWVSLRAELEPDDFTADDARSFAAWVGSPPAVGVSNGAGTFARTAVATVVADGRAVSGSAVQVASADEATHLPALLLPPLDAARVGAANRALERLGVSWRFGAMDNAASLASGDRMQGVSVTQRYRLVRAGSAASDTLATAGGDPWIVAGDGWVLTGSALDPAWTTLPVRAAFVPWLSDLLGVRLGAPPGDLPAPIDARPGAQLALPAGVTALENDAGVRRSLEGERINAPQERGVWYLLRGARRAGALVVNAPADESLLERETPAVLANRLGTKGVHSATSVDRWIRAAFESGSRRAADLPLLLLALVLLVAEALTVRAERASRSPRTSAA